MRFDPVPINNEYNDVPGLPIGIPGGPIGIPGGGPRGGGPRGADPSML